VLVYSGDIALTGIEQNEKCERLLIGKVTENCIYLLEAEPGSGIDTCLQSRDTNDFVDIKVEDMTDMHEEENPLRVECPVIKSELEITHTHTHTHTHTTEVNPTGLHSKNKSV